MNLCHNGGDSSQRKDGEAIVLLRVGWGGDSGRGGGEGWRAGRKGRKICKTVKSCEL
jgi:hypothetical protein